MQGVNAAACCPFLACLYTSAIRWVSHAAVDDSAHSCAAWKGSYISCRPQPPRLGSLFASASLSADDPRATILAETSSVDGSASCKQYVARKQLNQLFQTLSAEKHITAMQNFKCCQSCGHRAIDEHASVNDIGYCFFHVSMPSNHEFVLQCFLQLWSSKEQLTPRRSSMHIMHLEWLTQLHETRTVQAQDAERSATTGSVSLIFGGLTSDYELHLRVAVTIYDTAVACNLPVQ